MPGDQEESARARACCASIRDELARRMPEEARIFFGPELAGEDDPAVTRLRARGAHFFWMALPLSVGVVFWDAHAGIVVDAPTLTGAGGVHFARGSAAAAHLMARCLPALAACRLSHVISEAADEEQWVSATRDLSTAAAIGEACAELAALTRCARRAATDRSA